MAFNDTKRRLIWHGLLIFGLGLLVGLLVPVVTNPRMGVAAHVGATMSGMFLILVGLIWGEMKLPARAETLACWLFLYASYTGWLAQFLAAVFGASRATPIGGAGYQAAAWQEILVLFVALSFSSAILVACAMALWGLRGQSKLAGERAS